MSFVQQFMEGIQLPFRAVRLVIKKPRLLSLCLIPWVIAGVLSVYFTQSAIVWMGSGLKWVSQLMGLSFSGFFSSIFDWVIIFLGSIGGALFLVSSASLLMIPVADWLSEMVEPLADPPLVGSLASSSWFSRVQLRRLRIDLFKTLFSMGLSFLGLLLSFLPVLGLLGPILIGFSLVFQFVSYPQTRREEGLFQSSLFLFRHFFMTLGFGFTLVVGFSIPFFSVFFFPFAVVAGTLFYAKGKAVTTTLGE